MIRKAFSLLLALALLLPLAMDTALSAQAAGHCTPERGQSLIHEGRYQQAIREFTCVIDAQPTAVEGYRGRIEANLLLGQYAEALRDYARITAYVLPVHPDAEQTILDGYAARLAAAPDSIPALTGGSFAHWWLFDYTSAIRVLNRLLDLQPDNRYATLFRGSSRLLKGVTKPKGIVDLERALALAPRSPDVRFVVADAYTYGLPDPQRALAEASRALEWGLDTPRVHAILGSAYNSLGNQRAAAGHIQRHIALVTTELLTAAPLLPGASLSLPLLPGRTYHFPLPAQAGESLSIGSSSPDFYDTILVLLGPDGSPLLGADDYDDYFAGFEWVAGVTGTYTLQVTSFEGINTGELVVTRE